VRLKFQHSKYIPQGSKGFCRRPTGGKGAMDGAVRLKPRSEMSKQDVCECRAIPVRLKF
jgi:hypothetical protein